MSHGAGLVTALVISPVVVTAAIRRGEAVEIIGIVVFAASVVFLYLTSTLYHALPAGRAKRVFQVLDHGAIFLLIAGTYTPFTLGVLRGSWGWSLFGAVWGLALLGMIQTVFGVGKYPKASTALYLAMGWLIVVAAKPLLLHMPTPGLVWLLAGGLAYTTGVAFYVAKRLRYGHLVWHLFVLAGTACHSVAVVGYAG